MEWSEQLLSSGILFPSSRDPSPRAAGGTEAGPDSATLVKALARGKGEAELSAYSVAPPPPRIRVADAARAPPAKEPALQQRALVSPGLLLAFAAGLLAALLLPQPASGEVIASERGFAVDLPEGFSYADGDGKNRFSFADPNQSMEFDLFVYDPGRFATAEAIAANAADKLGSTGRREAFDYEGRKAVFLELAFSLNGVAEKGYGVAIAGRPAHPSAPAEPSFALLSFVEASSFDAYADFVLSTLDCFSVDRAARRSPGPVSQYVLAFPARREATKTLVFAGQSLSLPWSEDEASQVKDTATREYKVLEAYAGNEELWQGAWARFYRMIYRESSKRLDRLAAALDPLLPEDPTDAARALLQWTQGWTYERDLAGIDFVDPLSAAMEGRGDCDSRAMVLVILLERRGIDAILMVSRDYSHALVGIDVPGGGQRFPFEGKEWLVGETTAHVGLGQIAADQADWSKWLGIRLGY